MTKKSSIKQVGQGLVEYALILLLVAIVILVVLGFLGSSSATPNIPVIGKRPPYQPRVYYGSVDDIIIQDISVSSVKTVDGPVFGKDAKIAIYNFESPEGTQGGVLVGDIFASLLRKNNYQVFERNEIERILKEQQLIIEGRATTNDLEIAQKLGQLASVDYMVFGAVTLYNSEGQTIFLPVRVLDEDREAYIQEYNAYREWYINGFRLSFNRWTTSVTERIEMLRTNANILSLEELDEELRKTPREEFRTIATIGISAKVVNVKTGEIIWMGQAETTDFTLVNGASRVVEKLIISALE